MSIIKSIRNLLIEPALFFENYTKKGIGIPFLITLVYAVIAAATAFFAGLQSLNAAAGEMADMAGIAVEDMKMAMAGSTAAGAFFMAFVAWIAMGILFNIALKIFCKQPVGTPSMNFKDALHITAFGGIPLALSAVIELLISFTGTPAPWAGLLLSAAVLFLTIPIWVKGFEKFGAEPEKKVLTAVLVACIIPAAISVITTITTLAA